MILRNNQSNTLRSNTHSVVRSVVVVIAAILACSSSYQTVMAADDLCKKNGVGMTCTAGTLHSNIACCTATGTTGMEFYCKYNVQCTIYNIYNILYIYYTYTLIYMTDRGRLISSVSLSLLFSFVSCFSVYFQSKRAARMDWRPGSNIRSKCSGLTSRVEWD